MSKGIKSYLDFKRGKHVAHPHKWIKPEKRQQIQGYKPALVCT